MSFAEYWQQLHSTPVSVLHSCSCGRRRPIHELLVCTAETCCRFVCSNCTQVHIDTYYCPACLNTCFSSTAIKSKNRCETCLECPVCFHTLTVVASGAAGTELHEFVCEACDWSSASVGVTGATPAAALAKANDLDREPLAEEEFARVCKSFAERYRQTLREKADAKTEGARDVIGPPKPRAGGDAAAEGDVHEAIEAIERQRLQKSLEHYRLPAYAITQLQQPLPSLTSPDAKAAAAAAAAPAPAPAAGAVALPPFAPPTHLYGGGKAIDTSAVPSLPQRFNRPGLAPGAATGATSALLIPHRKPLMTKLAYRCGKCSKYAIKPTALAGHVTFDSKNTALTLMPRITVGAVPVLQTGVPSKIVLYFRNPTLWAMKIALSASAKPAAATGDAAAPAASAGAAASSSGSAGSAAGGSGSGSTVAVVGSSSATASFSTLPFTVTEFDDIAEQEDHQMGTEAKRPDPPAAVDGEQALAYRHLSKVGVWVEVTPLSTARPLELTFTVTVGPASGVDVKVSEFKSFAFETTVQLGAPAAGAGVTAERKAA